MEFLKNMYVFLNLPIWANFVDLTDLSLYLLLLPTTFRPANIILQPQPQPQQVEDQAGHAAQVEDEIFFIIFFLNLNQDNYNSVGP